MSKYKFEVGDDYRPLADGKTEAAVAGITVYEGDDKHENRIEIHGLDFDDEKALRISKELRDFVIEKLNS